MLSETIHGLAYLRQRGDIVDIAVADNPVVAGAPVLDHLDPRVALLTTLFSIPVHIILNTLALVIHSLSHRIERLFLLANLLVLGQNLAEDEERNANRENPELDLAWL